MDGQEDFSGSSQGEYTGEVHIYAHDEVLTIIRDLSEKLLFKKSGGLVEGPLRLIEVHDGETRSVIGCDVTFFDIQSIKAKQFGFCMDIGDGEKLTCCGDEPFSECERKYAEGLKYYQGRLFIPDDLETIEL